MIILDRAYIVQFIMKLLRSLIVLCFFFTAMTFIIDDLEWKSVSSLSFDNMTGSGVTQEMINFFNRACEAAYGFKREDIKANEEYIVDQMNKKFGSYDH